MNIIIPMAGKGKRMRPHTLTLPKPLISVAGKPIVHRLVEDLGNMFNEGIDNIGFVVGDIDAETGESLKKIAEQVGAKGHIFPQGQPLGTAHAILSAAPLLEGHVMVALADTLFYTETKLDLSIPGVIWTKKIEDPRAFGVVVKDEQGIVSQFVEKPQEFVSDEAIIGIYYFNDGAFLREELKYLIDNDIKVKGEYQVTDALENMVKKGWKAKTAEVTHWLDCGNKDTTVATNKAVLELRGALGSRTGLETVNSVVVEPCFIGENVKIHNSVVGPYASIGSGSVVSNSRVWNSIVQERSTIENAVLDNSMMGSDTTYGGKADSINLGDFSELR